MLGSGTQYHTRAGPRQAQAGLRLLAHRARHLHAGLVAEHARKAGRDSYLRDAAGQPVYSGPVNIGGRSFTLAPTAFPLTDDDADALHARPLGQEPHAGRVGLGSGRQPLRLREGPAARAHGRAAAGARSAAPARCRTRSGTGWNTLAAKGTWRPQGVGGAHIVDFGVGARCLQAPHPARQRRRQLARRRRRARRSATSAADTRPASAWAQDTWAFAPKWKAVLGAALRTLAGRATASPPRAASAAGLSRRAANRTSRPRRRWPSNAADDTVLRPRSAAPCASRPSASCTARPRAARCRSSTTRT